ncbi:hypothetical protein R1flu_001707 [Riccia fluitans]|uniref:Uncharacterized protein n=1 Tax=Riccia fluitans TaxID=41844 RepID=A0ABD1Y708_9MARC
MNCLLEGVQNKKNIQEWLVQEVAKALGEKMSMVAIVRELEDMLKMNGIVVPASLAMPLLTEVEHGVEEKIIQLKFLLGLPSTELSSCTRGSLTLSKLAEVAKPEPITSLVSEIEKVLSG